MNVDLNLWLQDAMSDCLRRHVSQRVEQQAREKLVDRGYAATKLSFRTSVDEPVWCLPTIEVRWRVHVTHNNKTLDFDYDSRLRGTESFTLAEALKLGLTE